MKQLVGGVEGSPVAGGPARVGRTPCWRPTFQPPRGRERRDLGRRPWFSCHCRAAWTVRSTHHLHLGRANANAIQRGMADSAVLDPHAACRRTCGNGSSIPSSKPAAPSSGRARNRVVPIHCGVGPPDPPCWQHRILSYPAPDMGPGLRQRRRSVGSNPMGPGLRPVVYNLLSSISVRTCPPAHAPRTPALVPSCTY